MAHPKGLLMERLRKQGLSPEFRTANTGPDHEPTFLTDVVVNGEVLGTGQGGNKRESERLAAEEALAYLDRNPLGLEEVAPTKESGAKSKKGARAEGRNQSDRGDAKKKGDEAEGQKKAARGDGQTQSAKATGQKQSGRKGVTSDGPARDREEPRSADGPAADRFEGPWPVFEHLLAGVVEVAGARVDQDLEGEEARVAVRDFTLELYKELLEDLGDIVDVEDEE
ncbi:MAG TPA: putative dsRNA-binding protein [Trueperaceae bacterium]